MTTFEFTGFGNFSENFNWDTGLNSSIQNQITFDEAINIENKLSDYNGWSYGLPCKPSKGIYYTSNEHNNSRNVEGFIIAENRNDAEKMLKEFDGSFLVVKYEADDYDDYVGTDYYSR